MQQKIRGRIIETLSHRNFIMLMLPAFEFISLDYRKRDLRFDHITRNISEQLIQFAYQRKLIIHQNNEI